METSSPSPSLSVENSFTAPAAGLPIDDASAAGFATPPMTGQNIVCFAKDWSETPTCNNHVMTELAKTNKVLWLNSIATRTPNLASARDLKKIFRKLGAFFRGATMAKPNLWIYTPVVLPLPHSRLATSLNRLLLKWMIRRIRRKLGMKQFQLWTFLPNTGQYIGKLGESISVYYCTDEWSLFTYVDGQKTAEAERQLLKCVDIVFATAQSLVDARLPINPNTHLARHGVDRQQFARALDPSTPIPEDLAKIRKPVLGFYGTIHDWIDFDLLCHLASRRPDWSIVLLGHSFVDVSRLKALPNIHLLGRKEHSQLAQYCKGFDVGIIPYIVNERIKHVNPVKLREYMSAGLPVISTAFPEVTLFPQYCTAAKDAPDFEAAVDAALRSDSPQLRRQRSDAMAAETWDKKVAEVGKKVMEAAARKSARLQGSIHP